MRVAQSIDLANAVLIFDEAHNVDSFLSDASSFELSTLDLTSAMSEIDRAVAVVERPEYTGDVSMDDLLILKGALLYSFLNGR